MPRQGACRRRTTPRAEQPPIGSSRRRRPNPSVSRCPGAAPPRPNPRAPRGRPSPTASLAPEPAPRVVSHATPAMRRYARELGVDLDKVKGTGRKGRVLREDISGFVKRVLSAPPEPAAGGTGIPPIPPVDFSKFGAVETRPLSRIKRISGPAPAPLVGERPARHQPRRGRRDGPGGVPPVDQGRGGGRRRAHHPPRLHRPGGGGDARGVSDLQRARSVPDGDTLVVKKYIHIGIAVDTPNGLMVPVMRDVDGKGVYDLAREMAELGARARDGTLKSERATRRHLHHLKPRRHRRHVLHPHHQRPRGRDPGSVTGAHRAGVGRRRVPAPADAAPRSVLGSPRRGRRRGSPIPRAPRPPARRRAQIAAVEMATGRARTRGSRAVPYRGSASPPTNRGLEA